jgi:DNA-binding beta-propeller fold protein YncE
MTKNYLILALLLIFHTLSAQDRVISRALNDVLTRNITSVATINFDNTLVQVNEDAGTVLLSVTLSESATLDVDAIITYSNDDTNSFNLDTTILSFIDGGDLTQSITLSITDNTAINADYMLIVALENNTGGTLGADSTQQVFVLDNEMHAPIATNTLGINFQTSFEVDGAEIVTHDANSQRLFVSNAGGNKIEIIDFSDPTSLSLIASIDMSSFGEEVTSVAAFDGVIAVASKGADQADGNLVFMDIDGMILSNVTVGSLPDMVTFSPDGSKVIVACEGEPNVDYTIDPEGSIGIIDMTSGAAAVTQTSVTLLDFNSFDANEAALKSAGVRIFGPGASVSQDLEPEYITISADGTKAYVSLQENNAFATINLDDTPSISSVVPFGYKDHSLAENALDATNRLDFVFMSTWNTLGMYQPDAISTFKSGNTNYLVTANEGDSRDYDGFSEETRVKDLILDPTAYPNASFLQEDETLGRLKTTDASGDIDNDGDIDQIYSYGGRSFSIFNADTGQLVFDSGDLIERILKEDPIYGSIFNTTDDENAFKNRSDDKGPEPEAVVIKEINNIIYAFIGLERIGGFMVFDITDPTAPIFDSYSNNRDTTLDIENPAGDLAPEGLIYVAPADNATDQGLIVIANETSSTISVYMLDNDTLSVGAFAKAEDTITIHPNPVNDFLFFSEKTGYKLFDLMGRFIQEASNATQVDMSNLTRGMYLLQFTNGTTKKVIVK